jgi:hypothetical protein
MESGSAGQRAATGHFNCAMLAFSAPPVPEPATPRSAMMYMLRKRRVWGGVSSKNGSGVREGGCTVRERPGTLHDYGAPLGTPSALSRIF